jgi:hypothetical protein
MSSGDSYQCSSMDDDDDELEGLSPNSIWKRNRKRKDHSDDEDYVHVGEEDEEEDDHKHITNAEYKGRLHPSPTPLLR